MSADVIPVPMQVLYHITLLINNMMSASMFIFTKISLAFIHPVVFAALRAVVNTFAMLPVALYFDRNFTFEYRSETTVTGVLGYVWKRTPNLKQFALLIACGLSTAVTQVCFITALSYVSTTLSATFTPVIVVMIALLSMILKNEEKSWWKLLGVLIAVLGAIGTIVAPMLFSFGDSTAFDSRTLIGVGLLSINSLNSAVNVNLQTVLMTRYNMPPLMVTAWMNFGNMFFTLALVPFFWSQCNFAGADWSAYYGVFYAGVIGASIPCTQTIFVAIFSYLVLDDTIKWYTAVGALVIISGVLVVAYAKYRESLTKQVKEEPIADIEAPTIVSGPNSPVEEIELDEKLEKLDAEKLLAVQQQEEP